MRTRFPVDDPIADAARLAGRAVRDWEEVSCGHGDARVVRLWFEGGGGAIAKRHATSDKHRRERDATRGWTTAGVGLLPTVLGARDLPPLLLLSELPGRPLASERGGDAEAVHAAAGRWAARLHRSRAACAAFGPDPTDLAEAYALRVRARLRTTREWVGPEGVRLLERLPALAAGRARTACHRDFGPWNWLTVGADLTGVIDLEHARADLPETDLARLATTLWPRRPSLRASFLGAYHAAGGPAASDGPLAAGCALLEAVGTVAWARRRGDRDLEEAGRAAARAIVSEAVRSESARTEAVDSEGVRTDPGSGPVP